MNDLQSRIAPLIAQGMTAQNAQRYSEAERAYRAALQIDPTDPSALALLGTLAGIAGQFQLAIDLFTRALHRDPTNADLYHNIGETYRQLGNAGKALPAFNRAVELRPNHYEAYRSAADAAVTAAEQAGDAGGGEHARELRRIAAKYLFNLGNKLSKESAAVAEPVFREAVDLDPGNATILFALGSILQPTHPTEAAGILRRAVALDPKLVEAHNNLGNAYFSLKRWDEAEEAIGAAVTIDPNSAMARQNLASIRLMRWLYEDSATAQFAFEQHRAWGEQATAEVAAVVRTVPSFVNSRDPDRKIRVAFLSGDFRGHSVANFFRPLLRHLAPSEVEAFCYAEVDNPDAMTENLRQLCANWRDTTKLNDGALRAQLRADLIDIAIDLAGHTAKNRLRALAVRAAPVTATWLGYPATTGLPSIDWRITDDIVDPPGAERFYTEKLIRLRDGFLCYEASGDDLPEVAPPPAAATGCITFGSFNNPQKLSQATIAAWAEILTNLPTARLFLKAPTLLDPGFQRFFLNAFRQRGIGPQRIVFRGFAQTSATHLNTYSEVDVALDPFPYNGTTTSCEALWMGVPIVTLIGDRHSGRVGLDLLTRIGLTELAATGAKGYIATATVLAQDLPRLREIRSRLREQMRTSALCDRVRFASEFERALREMWRHWCRA